MKQSVGFTKPITDFDEIRITVVGGKNTQYIDHYTFSVEDIMSIYNNRLNNEYVILEVWEHMHKSRYKIIWNSDNPPTGVNFLYQIEINEEYGIYAHKIEGIKYATIPTNEEFIAKNLIGRSFNVILNKTLIPVRAYANTTLQQFAELSCSIEEYDELVIRITVDWKINNVLSVNHFMQHDNIPIVSAKEYGRPCASFVYASQNSCSIGFIDDTHLGVLWCNKETSCNGMYVTIAGVKYETITDPITNTQVSTAVTETLGTLNMEGEDE